MRTRLIGEGRRWAAALASDRVPRIIVTATLSYGIKVVSGVLVIAAAAVGTAVLPPFSRMVAAQEWTGIRRMLAIYGSGLGLAAAPVSLALYVGAEPLVRLLFERGDFGPPATRAVAEVTQWLAPQIPFYLVGTLGVRLLNALGQGRAITWISAVNVAVNAAGNAILMRRLGGAGIALSTSCVYAVSCTLLLVAARRELRRRAA